MVAGRLAQVEPAALPAKDGSERLHGAGGENDRGDQLGMTVGDAYGDRPAERMPDDDDLGQVQPLDQLGDGVGERIEGVPTQRRSGTAEARQVDGDDTAVFGELGDVLRPVLPAPSQAMHEHEHQPVRVSISVVQVTQSGPGYVSGVYVPGPVHLTSWSTAGPAVVAVQGDGSPRLVRRCHA